MEKKRLPHITKTVITSQVFCFSNFDFVVGLSIGETGRRILLTEDYKKMFTEAHFSKTNNAEVRRTAFVDKSFIL